MFISAIYSGLLEASPLLRSSVGEMLFGDPCLDYFRLVQNWVKSWSVLANVFEYVLAHAPKPRFLPCTDAPSIAIHINELPLRFPKLVFRLEDQ